MKFILWDEGYTPDAVLKYLTLIGGGYTQTEDNSIEDDSLEDLVKKFSVHNLSSHSGHEDIEKLKQVNKVYLQRALNDNPDLITEQAMKVLRKHLQYKIRQQNLQNHRFN